MCSGNLPIFGYSRCCIYLSESKKDSFTLYFASYSLNLQTEFTLYQMTKLITYHLFLLLALISMAGCSSKEDITPSIEISSTEIPTLTGISGESQTFQFTSATDWTATSDNPENLRISPTSGEGGTQKLTLTPLSANCGNETRQLSFTITSETITKQVRITQNPVYKLDQLIFEVPAEGGEIYVNFQTDIPQSEFNQGIPVAYDEGFEAMWDYDTESADGRSRVAEKGTRTSGSYQLSFTISPNESNSARKGQFCLAAPQDDSATSAVVTVNQLPSSVGTSTNTQEDGKVSQLQSRTMGAGIPVVLLGDGFIDKDIESGKYQSAMEQAEEYFFSMEPVKTLREYFDVYTVTAVSLNDVFATGYQTKFGCKFGEGTEITGNDNLCLTYAKKAVGEAALENVLVIVVLNDTRYAGTCSIHYYDKIQDIPTGPSIAYIPMTDGTKYQGVGFEQILHHEAIGHGFGKLADEYDDGGNGTVISSEDSQDLQEAQRYGLFRNVDIHAEVSQTYWAKLAADSRFENEGLGTFEGAYTYDKGVYRPTQTSIMLNNQHAFNAPSREAIYKRVMSLANNGKYVYDYEAFVEFDTPNRAADKSRAPWQTRPISLPPLGRPKLIPVR